MTSEGPSGPITASVLSREGELGVALEFWLNLIDKEYLRDFIANGGSAVKFVESQPESLEAI